MELNRLCMKCKEYTENSVALALNYKGKNHTAILCMECYRASIKLWRDGVITPLNDFLKHTKIDDEDES